MTTMRISKGGGRGDWNPYNLVRPAGAMKIMKDWTGGLGKSDSNPTLSQPSDPWNLIGNQVNRDFFW